MPREFRDRVIYVVRSGDTLGGIATAHNLTLAEIMAANQGLINDPDRIQAGWQLVIPGQLVTEPTSPPEGTQLEEHTVAPGDTLAALARTWDTTVAAIAELNGIVDPGVIAVGQRIRRPSAGSAPGGPAAPPVDVRSTRLTFARYPLDPPAKITGGYREDFGAYLHRGIDMGGVTVGTPIRAPAAGVATVHRPGDGWGDGSFGICVVLDHVGTPWWSIYAHMDNTALGGGETVGAGDVIGAVGFTGRVEPPGPAGRSSSLAAERRSGLPTRLPVHREPARLPRRLTALRSRHGSVWLMRSSAPDEGVGEAIPRER